MSFADSFILTKREEVTTWTFIENLTGHETLKTFIEEHAGSTFNKGLYRVHNEISGNAAQSNVSLMFPEYHGRFAVVGFDWLGRQYAYDPNNLEQTFLFDIIDGAVYEAKGSLEFLHDVIICEDNSSAIDANYFKEWLTLNNLSEIEFSNCVGYDVPLFFGGEDTVENQSLTDVDVYWSVTGQLYRQAKDA